MIAELKESALHHCNNSREDSLLQRDRVIVRAQPTVEAIPKADYENRLKADMVAILIELQSEIEELNMHGSIQLQSYRQKTGRYRQGFERAQYLSTKVIQQKIDKIKGEL